MGLGVWFQEDIGRVLVGLASAGVGRNPEYFAALRDVALALGVQVPGPVRSVPAVVDEAAWRVLDVEGREMMPTTTRRT